MTMATTEPMPPHGLIDELVEEYGWTPEQASAAFEETARCVAASVVNRSFPTALSESAERVWRRWVLHTSDYMSFTAAHQAAALRDAPADWDLADRLDSAWREVAR